MPRELDLSKHKLARLGMQATHSERCHSRPASIGPAKSYEPVARDNDPNRPV